MNSCKHRRAGVPATHRALLMIVVLIVVVTGCVERETHHGAGDAAAGPSGSDDVVVVEERWRTPRNERDNIDSVATWRGDGHAWLLATAKTAHSIVVFDADTGERLDARGGAGEIPGRFLRPNGISVAEDTLWVVERDNRRVQVLSLPGFEPVGTFGEEALEKPYGLWIDATDGGPMRVFVTDSYGVDDDALPADADLDRRLHLFEAMYADGRITAAHVGAHGPTAGAGRLFKVESLFGDRFHDRLLVADEHPDRLDIKVFDVNGTFTGQTVARGLLRHEPEGIALYACGDGGGYWFVTDQHPEENRFLVFGRRSLEHVATFTGTKTRHTDGIWLDMRGSAAFPDGAFYAVDDDAAVTAFDLGAVFSALGMETCAENNGS